MPDNTARKALVGEIDSAIELAKRDPLATLATESPQSVCGGHRTLVEAIREDGRNRAFGQIVLLRCEKARLESPEPTVADAASTAAATVAREIISRALRESARHHVSRREIIAWCTGMGALFVGAAEAITRLIERIHPGTGTGP